ncbi:hypothetical protein ISN45_Aa04g033430, partial [Arabidopsis thaliana x Arabidopsis arenosa]
MSLPGGSAARSTLTGGSGCFKTDSSFEDGGGPEVSCLRPRRVGRLRQLELVAFGVPRRYDLAIGWRLLCWSILLEDGSRTFRRVFI